MNLKECYTALDGDFKDVSQRLFSEALVKKFVLKFLDDKSFSSLCKSMEASDYAQAFIAAHTLKGVCQNLSFTRLYKSANLLTEELRNGTPDVAYATELLAAVTADYQVTVNAIHQFQAEA